MACTYEYLKTFLGEWKSHKKLEKWVQLSEYIHVLLNVWYFMFSTIMQSDRCRTAMLLVDRKVERSMFLEEPGDTACVVLTI